MVDMDTYGSPTVQTGYFCAGDAPQFTWIYREKEIETKADMLLSALNEWGERFYRDAVLFDFGTLLCEYMLLLINFHRFYPHKLTMFIKVRDSINGLQPRGQPAENTHRSATIPKIAAAYATAHGNLMKKEARETVYSLFVRDVVGIFFELRLEESRLKKVTSHSVVSVHWEGLSCDDAEPCETVEVNRLGQALNRWTFELSEKECRLTVDGGTEKGLTVNGLLAEWKASVAFLQRSKGHLHVLAFLMEMDFIFLLLLHLYPIHRGVHDNKAFCESAKRDLATLIQAYAGSMAEPRGFDFAPDVLCQTVERIFFLLAHRENVLNAFKQCHLSMCFDAFAIFNAEDFAATMQDAQVSLGALSHVRILTRGFFVSNFVDVSAKRAIVEMLNSRSKMMSFRVTFTKTAAEVEYLCGQKHAYFPLHVLRDHIYDSMRRLQLGDANPPKAIEYFFQIVLLFLALMASTKEHLRLYFVEELRHCLAAQFRLLLRPDEAGQFYDLTATVIAMVEEMLAREEVDFVDMVRCIAKHYDSFQQAQNDRYFSNAVEFNTQNQDVIKLEKPESTSEIRFTVRTVQADEGAVTSEYVISVANEKLMVKQRSPTPVDSLALDAIKNLADQLITLPQTNDSFFNQEYINVALIASLLFHAHKELPLVNDAFECVIPNMSDDNLTVISLMEIGIHQNRPSLLQSFQYLVNLVVRISSAPISDRPESEIVHLIDRFLALRPAWKSAEPVAAVKQKARLSTTREKKKKHLSTICEEEEEEAEAGAAEQPPLLESQEDDHEKETIVEPSSVLSPLTPKRSKEVFEYVEGAVFSAVSDEISKKSPTRVFGQIQYTSAEPSTPLLVDEHGVLRSTLTFDLVDDAQLGDSDCSSGDEAGLCIVGGVSPTRSPSKRPIPAVAQIYETFPDSQPPPPPAAAEEEEVEEEKSKRSFMDRLRHPSIRHGGGKAHATGRSKHVEAEETPQPDHLKSGKDKLKCLEELYTAETKDEPLTLLPSLMVAESQENILQEEEEEDYYIGKAGFRNGPGKWRTEFTQNEVEETEMAELEFQEDFVDAGSVEEQKYPKRGLFSRHVIDLPEVGAFSFHERENQMFATFGSSFADSAKLMEMRLSPTELINHLERMKQLLPQTLYMTMEKIQNLFQLLVRFYLCARDGGADVREVILAVVAVLLENFELRGFRVAELAGLLASRMEQIALLRATRKMVEGITHVEKIEATVDGPQAGQHTHDKAMHEECCGDVQITYFTADGIYYVCKSANFKEILSPEDLLQEIRKLFESALEKKDCSLMVVERTLCCVLLYLLAYCGAEKDFTAMDKCLQYYYWRLSTKVDPTQDWMSIILGLFSGIVKNMVDGDECDFNSLKDRISFICNAIERGNMMKSEPETASRVSSLVKSQSTWNLPDGQPMANEEPALAHFSVGSTNQMSFAVHHGRCYVMLEYDLFECVEVNLVKALCKDYIAKWINTFVTHIEVDIAQNMVYDVLLLLPVFILLLRAFEYAEGECCEAMDARAYLGKVKQLISACNHDRLKWRLSQLWTSLEEHLDMDLRLLLAKSTEEIQNVKPEDTQDEPKLPARRQSRHSNDSARLSRRNSFGAKHAPKDEAVAATWASLPPKPSGPKGEADARSQTSSHTSSTSSRSSDRLSAAKTKLKRGESSGSVDSFRNVPGSRQGLCDPNAVTVPPDLAKKKKREEQAEQALRTLNTREGFVARVTQHSGNISVKIIYQNRPTTILVRDCSLYIEERRLSLRQVASWIEALMAILETKLTTFCRMSVLNLMLVFFYFFMVAECESPAFTKALLSRFISLLSGTDGRVQCQMTAGALPRIAAVIKDWLAQLSKLNEEERARTFLKGSKTIFEAEERTLPQGTYHNIQVKGMKQMDQVTFQKAGHNNVLCQRVYFSKDLTVLVSLNLSTSGEVYLLFIIAHHRVVCIAYTSNCYVVKEDDQVVASNPDFLKAIFLKVLKHSTNYREPRFHIRILQLIVMALAGCCVTLDDIRSFLQTNITGLPLLHTVSEVVTQLEQQVDLKNLLLTVSGKTMPSS